ncbi:hypothetical protein DOY81_010020, partial [Sarcophaga bullata]
MNGILAIFCDDIDSDAFCPNEGSCCITGQQQSATSPVKNSPTKAPSKNQPKPAQKPAQKQPASAPATSSTTSQTGGNDLFSQILSFAENTLSGGNGPATPPATQAPPKIPRCPGFCLLNIMAAFCERPSVLISTPTTCAKGSVCCDNSRAGSPRPPPQNRQPPSSLPPPTQPPYVIANTPAPDPREECPGSCIVSLLSFTCFKNAEMTD